MAATSFRKGRLQLPPDDSIPAGHWPGLGDEGMLALGETDREVETRVGAQIDSVPKGMDGGSSRGLYPCLNRHA